MSFFPFFSLRSLALSDEQLQAMREECSDLNDAQFKRLVRAHKIYDSIILFGKVLLVCFFAQPVLSVLYQMFFV